VRRRRRMIVVVVLVLGQDARLQNNLLPYMFLHPDAGKPNPARRDSRKVSPHALTKEIELMHFQTSRVQVVVVVVVVASAVCGHVNFLERPLK
jgi:hypothetical protein